MNQYNNEGEEVKGRWKRRVHQINGLKRHIVVNWQSLFLNQGCFWEFVSYISKVSYIKVNFDFRGLAKRQANKIKRKNPYFVAEK